MNNPAEQVKAALNISERRQQPAGRGAPTPTARTASSSTSRCRRAPRSRRPPAPAWALRRRRGQRLRHGRRCGPLRSRLRPGLRHGRERRRPVRDGAGAPALGHHRPGRRRADRRLREALRHGPDEGRLRRRRPDRRLRDVDQPHRPAVGRHRPRRDHRRRRGRPPGRTRGRPTSPPPPEPPASAARPTSTPTATGSATATSRSTARTRCSPTPTTTACPTAPRSPAGSTRGCWTATTTAWPTGSPRSNDMLSGPAGPAGPGPAPSWTPRCCPERPGTAQTRAGDEARDDPLAGPDHAPGRDLRPRGSSAATTPPAASGPAPRTRRRAAAAPRSSPARPSRRAMLCPDPPSSRSISSSSRSATADRARPQVGEQPDLDELVRRPHHLLDAARRSSSASAHPPRRSTARTAASAERARSSRLRSRNCRTSTPRSSSSPLSAASRCASSVADRTVPFRISVTDSRTPNRPSRSARCAALERGQPDVGVVGQQPVRGEQQLVALVVGQRGDRGQRPVLLLAQRRPGLAEQPGDRQHQRAEAVDARVALVAVGDARGDRQRVEPARPDLVGPRQHPDGVERRAAAQLVVVERLEEPDVAGVGVPEQVQHGVDDRRPVVLRRQQRRRPLRHLRRQRRDARGVDQRDVAQPGRRPAHLEVVERLGGRRPGRPPARRPRG